MTDQDSTASGKASAADASIARQRAYLLDRAVQKRVRDMVIERRGAQASFREGLRRPPLAEISDGVHQYVVARGELLVHQDDEGGAAAKLNELDAGYREASRSAKTVRFESPGRSEADLVSDIVGLRAEGLRAGPNQIYALNQGTMKGGVGPHFLSVPDLPRTADPKAGDGVRIAVVDTGIWQDADQRTDRWLDRVREESDNIDPLDQVPQDQLLDLGAGHGTFVAGLIRQVAPASDIVMIRAINGDGTTDDETVADAIVRAANTSKAQIINLSLGTLAFGGRAPVAVEAALEEIDREIVVVASAGNNGTSDPVYPAAFKRVVSVGALDRQGRRAPWSSFGVWVDVWTVGEGAVSTFVMGDRKDLDDGQMTHFTERNQLALWSGTSFAAPQVSGLVAAAMTQRRGCLGWFDRRPRSAREAYNQLLSAAPTIPGVGPRLDALNFPQ